MISSNYKNFIEIKGNNSFNQAITGLLQDIDSTELGEKMLKVLADKGKVFIAPGPESRALVEKRTVLIHLDRLFRTAVCGINPKGERRIYLAKPAILLAHELSHIIHGQLGINLNHSCDDFTSGNEKLAICGEAFGIKCEFNEHAFQRIWNVAYLRINHWVSVYSASQDPKEKNTDGILRIHDIACSGAVDDLKEVIEQDFSLIYLEDTNGLNAFHHAARRSYHVTAFLLQKDVKVNMETSVDFRIALDFAIANHQLSIMNLLFEKGALINHRDGYGNTPFLNAVFCNNGNAMYMLIQKGAEIYVENFLGENAFHLCKDPFFAKKFLKLGINPSHKDQKERTPLHKAVIQKNLPMVKFLIEEAKVDFDLKDIEGKTALDLADSPEILKYFLID